MDPAVVKQEPESDESETADSDLTSLYEDHLIKEEMVIGPTAVFNQPVLQLKTHDTVEPVESEEAIQTRDMITTRKENGKPRILSKVNARNVPQSTKDKQSLVCNKCNKNFFTNHSVLMPFVCTVCFSSNKTEKKTHFACGVCLKKFLTKRSLDTHTYFTQAYLSSIREAAPQSVKYFSALVCLLKECPDAVKLI